MILVNRNFGNPVLAEVIGDMFKSTSDDQDVGICLHSNALATGSSLVAAYKNYFITANQSVPSTTIINNVTNIESIIFPATKNFFLVTEHFIKTLDKVYTKIWNESFTETGIYSPSNLITLYNGFVSDNSLGANSILPLITDLGTFSLNNNFMLFKKFVDRCITAGILVEEDRLQYEDQISLNDFNKADLSTQIDLDNKLITFTAAKPIDIKPDLNAMATQYLNGKKLYLMMTPYLTNESVIKNTRLVKNTTSGNTGLTPTSLLNDGVKQEPIYNYFGINNSTGGNAIGRSYTVKHPIAFFKPKTEASKFGRSLPLATHLIWSIGTPEDKELALLEGKPVPDLIFDHLDRISHIDSLTLKIKFDKLPF